MPDGAVSDLRVAVEELQLLWERDESADAAVIVSASQLRVLRALERKPGSSLRELGEMVGSAPSALSRLCARLEAMGFVRRTPSPQSGREIELHLRRPATTYLRQVSESRERALAALLEAMPPGAVTPLAEGVAALALVLDAHLRPSEGTASPPD
ncbi:MarR family winged helix-turn-helix transcriptional regulator [Actinospica robiniae]|uniref:MarR family winged helix-turn-helix transcriptional regulator n=1 Tax=Actinospica robiniae TaxID=304901 RepID=UPI000683FD31|nr:MarR family transcriptional regulator [Actinospica robiniae]